MKTIHELGVHMTKVFTLEISILLLLLIAGTVVIGVTGMDMKLERMFYSPIDGWKTGDAQPWKFLYHYGNIPALLLSVGSLVLLLMTFISVKYLVYRKIALFFVLVMLVGPGLVVNLGFKSYWGRNRPRHVTELGGQDRYMQVWETGTAGQGKSFPCGHATMGFYLFAPYFLLRKSRKLLGTGFLLLGIGMGLLIGFARMLQGGHFASDVLWAGGIVYLVALIFYKWLKLDRGLLYEKRAQFRAKYRKLALWIGIPLVALAVALFLLASPYYKHKNVALDAEQLHDRLRIEIDTGDLTLETGETFDIEWKANGFGFPGTKVRNRLNNDAPDVTEIEIYRKGFYTEYHNDVLAKIPWDSFQELEIEIGHGNLIVHELPDDVGFETDNVNAMPRMAIKVKLHDGKLMRDPGGQNE